MKQSISLPLLDLKVRAPNLKLRTQSRKGAFDVLTLHSNERTPPKHHESIGTPNEWRRSALINYLAGNESNSSNGIQEADRDAEATPASKIRISRSNQNARSRGSKRSEYYSNRSTKTSQAAASLRSNSNIVHLKHYSEQKEKPTSVASRKKRLKLPPLQLANEGRNSILFKIKAIPKSIASL